MAIGDTPDIFHENILSIIDNWNGYPRQIPCDYANNAAIQAGIVELRCFINNTCPFNKSYRKEDIIIFNSQTMDKMLPQMPSISKMIQCTPGVDGLHFIPRYVFRHNYIYQLKQQAVPTSGSSASILTASASSYISNPDDYEEISSRSDVGPVKYASETRYKAEQTWIVTPAAFESGVSKTTEECQDARWMYQHMNISESSNSNEDIGYDYKTSAYNEHWRAVQAAAQASKEGKPASSENIGIPLQLVQVPVQSSSQSTNGHPLHWRLEKATPIFTGEDLFIRFYKKSKYTHVGSDSQQTPPFKDPYYDILDVTSKKSASKMSDNVAVKTVRVNYGITTQKEIADAVKGGEMSFDLYKQAYYIVELGKGSQNNNCFIIISDKNPPVFVCRQRFGNGQISVLQGIYDKIKGSQLIDAEHFTMVVRSHLGKIVVNFEVGGSFLEPWIISKRHLYVTQNPITLEPTLAYKDELLNIPRGRVSLWGGNMKCGFVFGPLQYKGGEAAFVYPPINVDENRGNIDYEMIDVLEGSPQNVTKEGYTAVFESNPFFLPSESDHHLLLTSSNIYLNELAKSVYVPNLSYRNYNLFTQDAQYYLEYNENDGHPSTKKYVQGHYFYGMQLKEFSDVGSASSIIRSSLISVRKNRYLVDNSSRHQAFEVLFGLMCGDHLFTSATWNYLDEIYKDPVVNWKLQYPDPSQFSENQWFVPNCKTPIMTHLRLLADEGKLPRWDDGTTISGGVAKTPFDNASPYFIDATDHVLNYSETWSANSWSEIEHTGSINFYLNREMTTVERNVTDYLLALQNKNFYIEIWAGYRNCSAANFLGLYKMFTGICQGGSISYEYNKNILSCKLVDYTVILKGEKFFNSPWFDGMKDINAIWEILQMVGLRSRGKYDSGTVVRSLSQLAAKGTSQTFFHHWDGRLFKMEPYALPSGYDRLEQPSFKFNDGDPLYDAIVKIAQKSGKAFYFDQFGIARYEDLQDVIEKDYMGRVPLVPLFEFTTNPQIWGGQLVFNKVERNYDVAGMANHIKILSNTPDMHLLIRDALSWSSIDDPTTEGFLGYKKTFYQAEGMFGSRAAVANAVTKYKVMWRPKVMVNFETYGTPLRANDIISINGEVTRVINVTHQIDAQKNEWWMQVECMKYQPVADGRLYDETQGKEWA
jgi:hypothetical protein